MGIDVNQSRQDIESQFFEAERRARTSGTHDSLAELLVAADLQNNTAWTGHATVSSGVAQEIKSKVGWDVEGYVRVAEAKVIRHILKTRGPAVQLPAEQVPITPQDIELLPQILTQPGNIFRSEDRHHNEGVGYSKRLSDGTVVVVEGKRDKRGVLALKTMWKLRHLKSAPGSIPGVSSETASGSLPKAPDASNTGAAPNIDPSAAEINPDRNSPKFSAFAERDSATWRADLANPGDNPEARALVDEARRDMEQPAKKAIAQSEREAEQLLKNDEAGVRRRILEASRGGGQLSDAEVAAAKRLVSRDGWAAVTGGSPAAVAAASELIQAYTRSGTEQARAFRMRFDPHESPVQRRRRILSEALLEPPEATKKKIRSALDDGDRARAERLRNEWNKKAQKLRESLVSQGILPGDAMDFEQLIRDPEQLMPLLRELAARKASASSVLLEYWYNAILSGPATHFKNTTGNMVNGLQKAVEGLVRQGILVVAGRAGLRPSRIQLRFRRTGSAGASPSRIGFRAFQKLISRSTCAAGSTKILPSPIRPVRAASTILRTVSSHRASSTQRSISTFGRNASEYSLPAY